MTKVQDNLVVWDGVRLQRVLPESYESDSESESMPEAP